MKKEMINSYLVQDPEVLVPMARNDFYKEQIETAQKTGHPTRFVDVVAVVIFNTKGELLLQKRSPEKNHNPSLIDKSLGGHVQYGDTLDYTVMVETVQELNTPSIVLRNKTDFEKTYRILKDYLNTVAVIRHIASDTHTLKKKFTGIGDLPIGNNVHLYFGVYDGRIRPSDGEAQGVLWYQLDHLKSEMESLQELFTDDIKFIMESYKEDLESFTKYIASSK